MAKNLRDIIFTIIVLTFICIVPVSYAILDYGGKASPLDGRALQVFPMPGFGSVMSGEFQSTFEKAMSDQFPGRTRLLMLDAMLDRLVSFAAYLPFDDMPVPVSSKSSVMRYRGRYLAAPVEMNEKINEYFDRRVRNYEEILRSLPDINLYVYDIEIPAYSDQNPANRYFHLALGEQLEKRFYQVKPEGLHFGRLDLESYSDLDRYFYKSDHHWNIHGAWKGYLDMYSMLAENYPDIGPPLENRGFYTVWEGLPFYGYYAREAASKSIWDYIEDVDVEVPRHRTLINGKEQPRSLREVPEDERRPSPDVFTSRYGEYFGVDYRLVEYRMDNGKSRNLLIIGPSYKQAMEVFLASHYGRTYAVDFRYTGGEFSLGEFVKEHDIKDVLVIGNTAVCLYDPQWEIRP